MTNDDEGEGGGGTIPPKIDDVIYEQPLKQAALISNWLVGGRSSEISLFSYL